MARKQSSKTFSSAAVDAQTFKGGIPALAAALVKEALALGPINPARIAYHLTPTFAPVAIVMLGKLPPVRLVFGDLKLDTVNGSQFFRMCREKLENMLEAMLRSTAGIPQIENAPASIEDGGAPGKLCLPMVIYPEAGQSAKESYWEKHYSIPLQNLQKADMESDPLPPNPTDEEIQAWSRRVMPTLPEVGHDRRITPILEIIALDASMASVAYHRRKQEIADAQQV